jgi:hypothetical protein
MSDLIIPRRSFLKVLTGVIAAPAVIKANNLMQVKTIVQPDAFVAYHYDYNEHTVTRKIIAPQNNMDAFKKIVMEGLRNIEGKYDEIDKRTWNRMFTPQRKGLFS